LQSQIRWRVVRCGHLLGEKAAVGQRVDDPVELGVDVLVLLARVRARRVHVRCNAVGHNGAARALVGGPFRDGVTKVLPDHALEGRHLARLVEPTEQVVERAVLEHQDHDVI
jgi:hypothetical protein